MCTYIHTYMCVYIYVHVVGRGSDVVCGGEVSAYREVEHFGGLKFPLPPSPSDETLICV